MYNSIALSGGGYRAICHLGALSYLEDIELLKNVEAIAGSSAGSLVAAMVILNGNENVMHLHKTCIQQPIFNLKYINPIKKYGLARLNLGMLEQRIEDRLGTRKATFKDLRKATGKRLIVTGFRIRDGETVYFGEDESTDDVQISKAIYASTAVPPIIAPVIIDGDMYIDGSLGAHVPMRPFRSELSENVIGFCIGKEQERVTSISDYASAILSAMMNQLNQKNLYMGHRIRHVEIDSDIDMLSLPKRISATKANELFTQGYQTMHRAYIHDIEGQNRETKPWSENNK